MEKEQLIKLKKKLIALGLTGVMFGTTGCTNLDENGVPRRLSISSEYSNVEKYYKYIVQSEEALKLYKSSNVYLLFDKETYEVSEYIYYGGKILGGLGTYVELYDLQSEEMLSYCDGIATSYNDDYYIFIMKNNYKVCLEDASDYVEGHESKEYYSLDEIKELEPHIAKSLKIINATKVKKMQ